MPEILGRAVDMDGTLLDTLEDMQDSVNHVLMAHGYPARTLEEVRAFVGNGAGKLMRRAAGYGGEEEFAALLLTEYKAWYPGPATSRPAPIRGFRSCWTDSGNPEVQVAIVSNKPDPHQGFGPEVLPPACRPSSQRDDLP